MTADNLLRREITANDIISDPPEKVAVLEHGGYRCVMKNEEGIELNVFLVPDGQVKGKGDIVIPLITQDKIGRRKLTNPLKDVARHNHSQLGMAHDFNTIMRLFTKKPRSSTSEYSFGTYSNINGDWHIIIQRDPRVSEKTDVSLSNDVASAVSLAMDFQKKFPQWKFEFTE